MSFSTFSPVYTTYSGEYTSSSSSSISYTLPTSTIFPDTPLQSATPTGASSQGSIYLYQQQYEYEEPCNALLSQNATPLVLWTCFNTPISGISGVSVRNLPDCPDYGNALLLVSNEVDCENSTAGTSADTGVEGHCQYIPQSWEDVDTVIDIKSLYFTCYGNGVAPVANETGDGPVEGRASVGFRPWKGGVLGVLGLAMLMVVL